MGNFMLDYNGDFKPVRIIEKRPDGTYLFEDEYGNKYLSRVKSLVFDNPRKVENNNAPDHD